LEVLKYKMLCQFAHCQPSSCNRTDRRTDCQTDTPNETNSRCSLSCQCLERQI